QSSVASIEQSAPLAQTVTPVADVQEQPALPLAMSSSSASVSSAPTMETKPAEVVTSPEKPAIKPSPASKPKASLTEDEEILLSWRADEYTLQLLGVSSGKA